MVGIISCVLLAWSGLVIAALGLIRCFTDGVWAWWPAALIVTIYTLAAIRVWRGL